MNTMHAQPPSQLALPLANNNSGSNQPGMSTVTVKTEPIESSQGDLSLSVNAHTFLMSPQAALAQRAELVSRAPDPVQNVLQRRSRTTI